MFVSLALSATWMAAQIDAVPLAPEPPASAVSRIYKGKESDPRDQVVPEMPYFAPCKFEKRARLVEHLSALPPEALAEVTRLFANDGGIADAGEFFESTDAPTSSAPSARFIRAYFVQNIWFIWFERGGIGLMRQVVALTARHDRASGKTLLSATPGSHFVNDLCAGSNAFLAGARSAG